MLCDRLDRACHERERAESKTDRAAPPARCCVRADRHLIVMLSDWVKSDDLTAQGISAENAVRLLRKWPARVGSGASRRITLSASFSNFPLAALRRRLAHERVKAPPQAADLIKFYRSSLQPAEAQKCARNEIPLATPREIVDLQWGSFARQNEFHFWRTIRNSCRKKRSLSASLSLSLSLALEALWLLPRSLFASLAASLHFRNPSWENRAD